MKLLGIILLTLICTAAAEDAWQTSTSVQLSVSCKGNVLGAGFMSPTAKFTVSNSKGQNYSFQRILVDTDRVSASFPEDFSADLQNGTYMWSCTINDFEVGRGKFVMTTMEPYDQVTIR